MKLSDLSDRQRMVLATLRRFPQGATRAEMSRAIPSITPSQIGSALNRLEGLGLADVPYTAGERWHISAAGKSLFPPELPPARYPRAGDAAALLRMLVGEYADGMPDIADELTQLATWLETA